MNQKAMPVGRQGFSQIILFGIVAFIILAGAGGFFLVSEKKTPPFEKTVQQGVSLQKTEGEAQLPKTRPQNTEATGLGNICSGKDECTSFCHNHRGRCEAYCKGNNKNELCRIMFPSESIPSCGNNKELFTIPPVSFGNLEVVAPLGSLNPSGHVFPTDHIYMNVRSSGGVSNIPERSGVVSPGEVYITRITSSEHLSANPPFTDYDLEFYPCKEVYAKFGHVTSISQKLQSYFDQVSGDCTSYSTGGSSYRRCSKRVSLKLEAGEEIGTTGGFKGAAAGLDFWLADYRTEKISYANPSRWGGFSFNIVCPVDYFTADIRSKMYTLFKRDGVPRTIEPICGTIEQDVAGTAQGVWFVKGAKETYPEDQHLALAHDNFNPLKGVFSVGTSMTASGLNTGAYYFDPKSSGFVNRDFKDVASDGNVYCYDSLTKRFEYQVSPMRIILQLTSGTKLRIEKQNMNECGGGSWVFASTYADFER